MEYHRRFTARLEEWLDEGMGCCLFDEEANREILEEVMMRFQGTRVEHQAWVIMPNHVHALFVPREPLPGLIKVWKGVSARSIRRGSIWQENYRDTMIRDEGHFARVVSYIRRNPRGLGVGRFTLWEAERAKTVV
ncbi:hypothetical protein FEM03_17585 [Phragmitibacter flavus]|uniref:Transposase IS200-like domain-containing protein n=1 Tax=Phragmitibacter flavus TaxID=2576071 RepID=A0A5R8KAW4_9BACT|nr:transposase [Phragmitibacter flavus]TLD69454.1 hypothetical protein FEM03_17585 [Phragmitibacter flavus]